MKTKTNRKTLLFGLLLQVFSISGQDLDWIPNTMLQIQTPEGAILGRNPHLTFDDYVVNFRIDQKKSFADFVDPTITSLEESMWFFGEVSDYTLDWLGKYKALQIEYETTPDQFVIIFGNYQFLATAHIQARDSTTTLNHGEILSALKTILFYRTMGPTQSELDSLEKIEIARDYQKYARFSIDYETLGWNCLAPSNRPEFQAFMFNHHKSSDYIKIMQCSKEHLARELDTTLTTEQIVKYLIASLGIPTDDIQISREDAQRIGENEYYILEMFYAEFVPNKLTSFIYSISFTENNFFIISGQFENLNDIESTFKPFFNFLEAFKFQ